MRGIIRIIAVLLFFALLSCGFGFITPAMAIGNVKYIEYAWDEDSQTLNRSVLFHDGVKEMFGSETMLTKGWYVAQGSLTYSERLTVSGAVNLILADGCVLTAEKGITVQGNNSLTIYAQSEGTATGILKTVLAPDKRTTGKCGIIEPTQKEGARNGTQE